jgi:hypothetical protein
VLEYTPRRRSRLLRREAVRAVGRARLGPAPGVGSIYYYAKLIKLPMPRWGTTRG